MSHFDPHTPANAPPDAPPDVPAISRRRTPPQREHPHDGHREGAVKNSTLRAWVDDAFFLRHSGS